ncbi:MAG: tRNA dihydrouridine synthase DusB [Thermodesulfobacteriota bacterium]|nr:tRNA dihydrouridine synthase DusB [Thermodesulfobacteriota bacterium]
MEKIEDTISVLIGNVELKGRFVLAPLAGYTDLAFRILCREYGAALCYSEMISCHGLSYRKLNTKTLIRTVDEERPVAFQLFGADPDIMGDGAAILSELPIDLIDINMGCPAKKVVKKGSGAALMNNPGLAARIMKSVIKNSRVPVMVKIRSGWDHSSIVAENFSKMAEQCGIRAIAIHGRTWSDGFSGKADWNVIAKVKQAVSIPVIGNGDVVTRQDGLDMIEQTGCDMVMIGRGALGNPRIFGPSCPLPSLDFQLTALRRHLELIEIHHDPARMLARIKNHSGRYFKGIPNGTLIRKKIYATKKFSELKDFISRTVEELSELRASC